MKTYENALEMVEREIDNITKRGELNQNDLCNLDKLIDISKDIETIFAMKDYGYSDDYYDNGYSGRAMRNGRGNGRMYDGYYSYDNGNYNRSYGGHERNEQMNGYSGHGDKKHMLDLMYDAMNQASTNDDREEIRKMIQKLEQK